MNQEKLASIAPGRSREMHPAYGIIATGAAKAIKWNVNHRKDGGTISEGVHEVVDAFPILSRLVIGSLALHWMFPEECRRIDAWHIGHNILKKF